MARLNIVNDGNSVLVDSSDPTLGFRSKKVCSIPTPATSGQYFANYGTAYVDFDNCDMPAFAVRPPNGKFVSVWLVEQLSQTTWRVHLQSGQPFEPDADWGDSGSGRVDGFDVMVYHFDRPLQVNVNGPKLRVRDGAGKITFDSAQKPAIVCASQSELGAPYGNWTLPAGRIGACIMGVTFQYLYEHSQSREQWLRNWFGVNNNQHIYHPMLAFYRVVASGFSDESKITGFHSGVLIDVTEL